MTDTMFDDVWAKRYCTLDATASVEVQSMTVFNAYSTRLDGSDCLVDECTYFDSFTSRDVGRQDRPNATDTRNILGIDDDGVGISCSKCKTYNVQYNLVQNRRGDEGMTAHCVCRVCKHRFRMN